MSIQGMRYQGPIILRTDSSHDRWPVISPKRAPRTSVVHGQTLGKITGKRSTLSLHIMGRWFDMKIGQ